MIELSHLPRNPGCYLFKDDRGKVIYVGKAKNLAKRVKSYFQKKDHDAKTKALVSAIVDVDVVVTTNEYEALVLENNLIKKHRPRYNIDLKDSRRYAYIKITKEQYPRVMVARTREEDAEYYGPFVSAASREYVLEFLQKVFRIRTCKKLPKKACLRYSLGLCSAPCVKKITREEYLRDVNSARLVLKGKIRHVVKVLDAKMRQLSRDLEFEKALTVRNQISAIKDLNERQNMERQKRFNEDIIHFIVHDGKVHLLLFNSRRGILENKQDFEFDEGEGFLDSFLVQYYSEHVIPKEIIVPKKPSKEVMKFLEKKKRGKLTFVVPVKGEKKQLLDLVHKNLELSLFGDLKRLEELQEKLKLGSLPKVIECFDISHLSGTSTVASMVQFRNGKADKNNYRRFKIRTVDQIDDYAAMKEVLGRRYSKLKAQGQAMPDLILIDGGKGQLSAALDMLQALFLKIPVIAIAKREEEIFVPGRKSSIQLSKKSGALKLVQTIRDEAHRFAINYNKLLRSKKMRE